jgi:hypothetical protein
MLPRLEAQHSQHDKVITLLLQHSVYAPYRPKILPSVSAGRTCNTRLPKTERPVARRKAHHRSSSRVRLSVTAALGFALNRTRDLKITLLTFKYHVMDLEKCSISHVVWERNVFPMGRSEQATRTLESCSQKLETKFY